MKENSVITRAITQTVRHHTDLNGSISHRYGIPLVIDVGPESITIKTPYTEHRYEVDGVNLHAPDGRVLRVPLRIIEEGDEDLISYRILGDLLADAFILAADRIGVERLQNAVARMSKDRAAAEAKTAAVRPRAIRAVRRARDAGYRLHFLADSMISEAPFARASRGTWAWWIYPDGGVTRSDLL